MSTNRDIFLEQRNALNSILPPKNLFSIEWEQRSCLLDTTHPYHYHDWYELYYITSGKCKYRIDNAHYNVDNGSIILIPPKNLHKTVYISETHERWLLYFSKGFIDSSILTDINEIMLSPISLNSKHNTELINSIFHKMYDEFKNPTQYSSLLYKTYLTELFVHLINSSIQIKPTYTDSTDMAVGYAVDYIKQHYAEPISIDEIAETLGISTAYLLRKFKHFMGIGLSSYLRTYRLDNAKKLLINTNKSITDIAYICGFSDSNYFSYVFKNEIGISPLKYRKQNV